MTHPMLSTITFPEFVWLVLAVVIVSAFVGPILINAWRASRSSGQGSTAEPGGPRIIVNIPENLKAIAPLPGDTSIEGQRAVLWFHVYKEAVDGFTGGGDGYLTATESEYAVKAANEAVAGCYGSSTT